MKNLSPEASVAVVPNTIDVDRYAPAPLHLGSSILYLGGMDYYPNRDAVQFFITQILPELRTLVPDVTFTIAYSANHAPTDDFLRQFGGHEDVKFVESADLRTQITESTIFVVPIRVASGTRFKILEAAAMAKPIVSTRIGAEGLDFADGTNIILADQPKMFARSVADLLRNPSQMRHLGLAARHNVERRYSFETLRDKLRIALQGLMNGNYMNEVRN